MLRSAASKVMWLGRTTSAVVGLVILLALAVGAANSALAHTKVDNRLFHLGHSNSATKPTSLVSTLADAAKSALIVNNKSGGPALDLRVQAGAPPIKVNSSAEVANLHAATATEANSAATAQNAANLGGEAPSAFQKRVSGECAAGSSIRSIGINGTSVACEPDDDLSGDAAGGDLSGTYPNPQIAQNAVSGGSTGEIANNTVTTDDVANDSLRFADMQNDLFSNFSFFLNGEVIEAQSCYSEDLTGSFTSSFDVGELVVTRLSTGTLPDGIYIPAYVVAKEDVMKLVLCNATDSDITLSGSSPSHRFSFTLLG